MKKRVRMVDIARAAQVSQTTVSLVLNQIPGVRIAGETRQRVLQVARELGYAPGPALHELDPARSRIFGVLINEISAAYPINLIDGLQTWADAQAAQLLIQVTGGIADHETAALENFRRFGVDGVVLATTFTAFVEPPELLASFPHVFLNCRRKDKLGVSVLPGERSGGFVAAQHLIDIGCKRLATITGDPWQQATISRRTGFRQALRRAGLPHDPSYEKVGNWSHRRSRELTSELLALPEPPDGIFCQNDIMARGAMAAIREAGLRIPQDVAVVGYDDREFAKDLEPPLTSITLPHAEMAERTMQHLVAKPAPHQTKLHSIRGELVMRASTARRRN